MACTIACASFFGKALFCQNPNHFDIPTSIPTIGNDPILDTCLCQQSVISPMQSCASCRAKYDITDGDVTWVFLDACNRLYPERRLWLQNAATPGVKPWGFGRHRVSAAATPHSSTRTRTHWNLGRLVETANMYSVLLVISITVSVCSSMITS
ncbi:hypothetical protein BGZ50_008874 [Haplosporangium sp. Z 11]|nr:hypothetical protein BGZ50_008874 [Haplosporangium sp. Z 11]